MRSLPFLLVFFCSFLTICTLKAQTQQPKSDTKAGVMKTYYFVMLKKGPKRDQDSATAAKIQAGHMENMERLAKEGKLAIAGPFTDNGDWRGIFIFDAANMDEVKKWVETDPAIIAGRLTYEIHPWMSMQGAKLP